MTNIVHGEVSWNDNTNFGKDKKSGAGKDLFLRLDKGSNVVRVLTQPHQYLVHKGIKKDGDRGFGRKVSCSRSDTQSHCPLCEMGYESSTRWLVGVISRPSGAFKVLDISWQVCKAIKQLNAKTDVWGDPTKYDIDIIVDPESASSYYSVQPIPHKPLSAADQKTRDDADLNYLKERTEPLTPEVVQKIIDKIADGGTLAPPVVKESKDNKAASKNGKTQAKPPVRDTHTPVDNSDEDDVDDIFPAYDGNA
jgi:hypothetical protein